MEAEQLSGRLNGRVAIVTGSTSGIGWGIARALARSGSAVMLNGFGDPATVEALRLGLENEFKVPVRHHGADVADPQAVEAMVVAAVAEFGGLDILVNNAGLQHVAKLTEFPLERWERIIAVNLSGVFYGMRYALPVMEERGWGRIVNIASAHGLVASGSKVAYVAAKHGVVGATKVAAIEAAASGVTVNAICPGWVLTPLVARQLEERAEAAGTSIEEAKRQMLAETQPLSRFTTPEQVGELTVFLCGPQAATITGAALPIDGGWVAH